MKITREYLEGVNPDGDLYPAGFDDLAWKVFRADLVALKARLSEEFGRGFGLTEIQDSTHGAEIGFPDELVESRGEVVPMIRVSNHRRLYVITVSRRISVDTEARVESVASRLGFRYTPESLFGLPFDQRARTNGDLFNQLFDYV